MEVIVYKHLTVDCDNFDTLGELLEHFLPKLLPPSLPVNLNGAEFILEHLTITFIANR